MMRNFLSKLVLLKVGIVALFVLIAPAICFAHPGHDLVFSFGDSIAHPLSGLDYFFIMIAVGLWSLFKPYLNKS